MTKQSIIITRHADGATLTLPLAPGVAPANVGGHWMYVEVPCLSSADCDDAYVFAGHDVEDQMQYLYVDGHATSGTFDDYSYTLA
jgi:prepilin-type processing-associated H-X9-DG protein